LKTSADVLNQIISFAVQHDSIRLVLLNGSRVNPHILTDEFSDYDVIFAVDSYQSFIDDLSWIAFFGNLLIHQLNYCTENTIEFPIFLLQYRDGVRIDVTYYPVAEIDYKLQDSLTRVLLDKDLRITDLDEPSDRSYWIKQPPEAEYYRIVNEFWWCIITVGKGIARKELCYAKYMYESIVRECFLKIVSWYCGYEHGWKINIGKYGRFLQKNLPNELWERIKRTYNGTDDQGFWESIYQLCHIVIELESYLSKALGYPESQENGREVIGFLKSLEERPAQNSV